MTRPDKTFIIGLPVWVTPKRLCQKKKKKKWRTEHLEGLRVPSTLQLGQLLRGGDGSRFGTNLLRGVIGPISTGNDYLNTVFDYLVSLRGSCRNKRTSHVSTGKASPIDRHPDILKFVTLSLAKDFMHYFRHSRFCFD